MHKKEEYILRKSIGEELTSLFTKRNCVLAGGAITSIFSRNKINDYDIYFHNNEGLYALQADLKSLRSSGDICEVPIIKLVTDNAITYSFNHKTFQLICLKDLICSYPRDIIEQFDFTVCMGAYDFSVKSFFLGDDFLKHLAQRSLVYNIKSKYPFASLYRAIKYIKKGFNISGIEMLKLGLKCNNIQINNFKDLSKQLMGVDTLFLRELTDKLSSAEMAEKIYDFDLFLQMMDEHLSRVSELNVGE